MENVFIVLPTSGCVKEWKCISSGVKAYQYENCSYGERKTCANGCENNTCKATEVCTPGFKCHGNYYKGYQLESCDWISQEKCEYGCANATCKPEPNVTQETAPTSAATPAPVSYPLLKIGETATIGINSTLKIYIIEEGQVRLLLDERKTDWLTEGANVSFRDGTMIVIKEILFQSYSGGSRAISYVWGDTKKQN